MTMRRPGFTLVEVIVAIVLMAVLSAVVAPRFLDTPGRSAAIEARALASTLDAAVRRAASVSGAIRLRVPPDRDGFIVERRDDSSNAGWRPDPLIPSAALRWLRVRSVREGGFDLRAAGWALTLGGGQPRPDLIIVLERVGADGEAIEGERARLVALAALEHRAVIAMDGDERAADSAVVDLDLSGRGNDAW